VAVTFRTRELSCRVDARGRRRRRRKASCSRKSGCGLTAPRSLELLTAKRATPAGLRRSSSASSPKRIESHICTGIGRLLGIQLHSAMAREHGGHALAPLPLDGARTAQLVVNQQSRSDGVAGLKSSSSAPCARRSDLAVHRVLDTGHSP